MNSRIGFQRRDIRGRKAVRAVTRKHSKRQPANTELKKQHSTLQEIINNVKEPIFSLDRQYHYTCFNKALVSGMKAIYGKDIEIGGSLLDDMTVSEDREKAKRNLDRALAGETFVEETYSGEEALSRLYLQLSHSPITTKSGAIIGVAVVAKDITERKRAEETLRESEGRYRTLFESASDAIFIHETAGRFLEVNRVACERLGYSREELLRMSPKDIDSPEYARVVAERVEELRKVGHAFFETAHVRRDGAVIPIELSSQIIEYQGQPAVLSIARDITQRKQMEKLKALHTHALLIGKARCLDEIVRSTLDAMEFTLGFVYASFSTNEGGYNHVQGFRGRKSSISMLPLNGPGVVVKAALSKTSIRISDNRREPAYVDLYAESGRELTMLSELAVPVIVNDEAVAILNVENARMNAFSSEDQMLVEILANHVAAALNRIRQEGEIRQHSEHLQDLVNERTRKLSESEKRFRELADSLPELVFEADERGVPTYFNRVGLSSTGYREDEIRSGFALSKFLPSEDTKRAMEGMRRVLRGERVGPEEYSLLRKDGTSFPVMIHSSAVIREGKPVGLRGIAIDMTERKEMEARLLKTQHLASVGEAAAMVGHDLRNPLQGMTGALYLMKKLSRSENVEDRKEVVELLDMLDGQIRYMDKIVSDLQSYAGPVQAEPAETNLPNLVREVVLIAHVPGNVEAHVQVEGDLSNVMVDGPLLQRVLVNLVLNAVQAMPKGGNLTLTSHKEQESAIVTVEDTGEGITKENMDKIFAPFFTTKAQGQGLGLAVCRRLVEAQGGTITVKSEIGKGSTFTLKIPTSRLGNVS